MPKVNPEEIAFAALKGKYKHYCEDWDGLAIDETCSEFEYCRCFKGNAEVRKLQDELWDRSSSEWWYSTN